MSTLVTGSRASGLHRGAISAYRVPSPSVRLEAGLTPPDLSVGNPPDCTDTAGPVRTSSRNAEGLRGRDSRPSSAPPSSHGYSATPARVCGSKARAERSRPRRRCVSRHPTPKRQPKGRQLACEAQACEWPSAGATDAAARRSLDALYLGSKLAALTQSWNGPWAVPHRRGFVLPGSTMLLAFVK